MKGIFYFILLLLVSMPVYAEGQFLEKYVRENKLNATVIVESINSGKRFVYNKARAGKRFTPSSTFDIVNSLIFLKEGAVRDEKEIIPWEETDSHIIKWEKEYNLEGAFAENFMGVYQKCASKIAIDVYTKYIREFAYGNMTIGKRHDLFWLYGDITISATEQLDIIKGIHRRKFSFTEDQYTILKRIMIVEQKDGYTLYGKTGYTLRSNPNVGWFVGYVETGDDIWMFAANIDIEPIAKAFFVRKIVYQALTELSIINK